MDEEVVVLYRCQNNTNKRNCPCCEAENEADESYCFFCGTSLIKHAAIAEPQASNESNTWKWVVGIVAAAAVAAIAILAVASL